MNVPENNQDDVPIDEDMTDINRRRGGNFTAESRQKAQETRRRNNVCGKCGERGHFIHECTNERIEGFHKSNKFQRGVDPYDILEDMKNTRSNATFGQIYNNSKEQRKKVHEGFRNYPENQ